jgi:hypothetical protein
MIYLVRHYMVLVTILGSLLLFTLQGTYTFSKYTIICLIHFNICRSYSERVPHPLHYNVDVATPIPIADRTIDRTASYGH